MVLFALILQSFAQSDTAIMHTQQFLLDDKAMKQFATEDANAKKAMKSVEQLSGSDPMLEKSIYEASAQIFGNFQGKSPEEILKVLENAQKDPKSFFNNLSIDQQKLIRDISLRIPASKAPRP